MYICMYVWMNECMYVCMYICMCMYVCTYVCMYVCFCVCVWSRYELNHTTVISVVTIHQIYFINHLLFPCMHYINQISNRLNVLYVGNFLYHVYIAKWSSDRPAGCTDCVSIHYWAFSEHYVCRSQRGNKHPGNYRRTRFRLGRGKFSNFRGVFYNSIMWWSKATKCRFMAQYKVYKQHK